MMDKKEKSKSIILQVQNVKGTIKIDTVGGGNDGKKRS